MLQGFPHFLNPLLDYFLGSQSPASASHTALVA